MTSPRVSAAVALPLCAFGYAIGGRGIHSVVLLWGVTLGISYADLGRIEWAMGVATLVGAILSAIVGAAIGPSATASLGLGIAAVGCVAAGFESAATVVGAPVALGLGRGLFHPAVVAAAARPFSRAESGWIAVVVLAVYLAANGGGMPAPALAGALVQAGPWVAPVTLGAVLVVAAAIAAADAVIQRRLPSPPVHVRPVGIAVGIALLVGICAVAQAFSADAGLGELVPVLAGAPALYSVAPFSVFASGLLVGLVFVGTSLGRVRLWPSVVGGVGYMLSGVVLLPLLAGPPPVSQVVPLLVLAGAAQVATVPAVVGAIAGVHWRLSTALAAIPFCAGTAAALAAPAMVGLHPSPVAVVALAAAVVLGGGVLAGGAFLADQRSAARVEVA